MIPHARGANGPIVAVRGGNATSGERYRTLFETMPQGVVHYDRDGSVIGVNPAASEILGIDLTAVVPGSLPRRATRYARTARGSR